MATKILIDAVRTLQSLGQRPALSWYGHGGERIELSGSVLLNWRNKTTNFLIDEFDAHPGTHIAVDIPPHWRAVVWYLSAWTCGATVIANGDAPIAVTSNPAAWVERADEIVAVPLPSLARRFEEDLPPGAIDAGPAVMGSADALGYVPQTNADLTAVRHGGVDTSFWDLDDWGRSSLHDLESERVVIDARTAPTASVVRSVISTWARGAAAVVVSDQALDDPAIESVARVENAALHLG
ncbi:TIGR03089 family protein [Rarobacter incanus]|uniref:Uncharacterized protein (TIGR03089 family) n=1 Tax=Rarobacter incanus TaxID=153494 RepID=A0A542SNN0_9MICO|nr:TIGR03089 family protein [Rarobacter incanus]TQK76223.1 uncharacterized protein (TIGR03089 family) [Rarobacter incanus]